MILTTSRGFIALMSAIIISAVLLSIIATQSLAGLYERSNVLDAEFKSRSVATAFACAEQTFLLVGSDPSYTGVTKITLNAFDSCQAFITGDSTVKNIRIQATSSAAVTNVQLSYNPITLSIISWQEIPVF
jgi:Tfp pilus assembly protein PilE